MTTTEALHVLDAATETQAHARLTKRDHVNVVAALETLAATCRRVEELEAALAVAHAPVQPVELP